MDFTADKENTPGLLIFIDFQKAFDTLEWSYLYKCLETFNFGDEFIRWVRTFYQNIQSYVINNGTASEICLYYLLTTHSKQCNKRFKLITF